jgi:hypothetical protein
MTYRGHVRNGVVVLDGPALPPEGVTVKVEPLEDSPAAETPNIWAKLCQLAGRARGLPDDAAENHDHYLYGTPKR